MLPYKRMDTQGALRLKQDVDALRFVLNVSCLRFDFYKAWNSLKLNVILLGRSSKTLSTVLETIAKNRIVPFRRVAPAQGEA